jgi:hypothetical protein
MADKKSIETTPNTTSSVRIIELCTKRRQLVPAMTEEVLCVRDLDVALYILENATLSLRSCT